MLILVTDSNLASLATGPTDILLWYEKQDISATVIDIPGVSHNFSHILRFISSDEQKCDSDTSKDIFISSCITIFFVNLNDTMSMYGWLT